MTPEQHLRFGLSLPDDKPIDEAIFSLFDDLMLKSRKDYESYKVELEKLRKELDGYKQSHFNQLYNRLEIERCWQVIGNYNRKHLELHEAIREKLREYE